LVRCRQKGQAPAAEVARTPFLPQRPDLADDLLRHVAERNGNGDGLLFDVPRDFKRVFDGDLAAAGIPKTNAQGRTLACPAARPA